MPVRLKTNENPSHASINAAARPRNVERVNRRTTKDSRTIATSPAATALNRQPVGVYPKSHSPRAIFHLPNGGWTMK